MYELLFHPQVDKELEKLPKSTIKTLKEFHLLEIARAPFVMGIPLSGPLSRFRKYVFSHKGISYRIAFEIDKDTRTVYILMVGKREGFYERLERRTRGL